MKKLDDKDSKTVSDGKKIIKHALNSLNAENISQAKEDFINAIEQDVAKSLVSNYTGFSNSFVLSTLENLNICLTTALPIIFSSYSGSSIPFNAASTSSTSL